MYKLILFVLTTAGISYIITQSKLFQKLREWVTQKYNDTQKLTWWFLDENINCPMCLGFWVGILVYLAIIYDLEYLCYPFMGSICSYMIYLFIKNLKR